ncbi:MAG TPA: SDR family oxidoreductase [Thermoanaerobaculia bacterium]
MILVTGATGKVGGEVVRQLSAAGVPVRALVRDPMRASPIRLPGVEIVVGDLGKPETLDHALSGVDRLFLLSPAHPDQVSLQSNAIEASKRAGVGHVVKVSVAGGPDSGTQIGRWHWATEKQLEASGIDFTMLRPNLYMQQMLTLAPSIAATGTFSLPLGTAEVSVVDTRDVAAVAVCALTENKHSRKIYDLTGPEALSFDAVADAISEATGKKVSYVHVPPEYARKQLLASGVPRWLVDDMLILFASYREGYGAAVSDTIREVTKHHPRTFHHFAKDYAQVFRDGR